MSAASKRDCVVTPWRDSRPFYQTQAESGEISVICCGPLLWWLPARAQPMNQGSGIIDGGR